MTGVHLDGIRTIVSDLDDTLYLERDFACSGFDAVARWLEQQHIVCPFDPAARMRELFETGDRRRIFDRLLEEAGCAQIGEVVPAMVECYRNHLPRISLMPDAERALDCWAGRFHLALISDGPLSMQTQKVRALGLTERFNQILLTDTWGKEFWKPHPRAFESVEAESGFSGQACVYIADNPLKDFITPNRRGWRTVRISRPGGVYGEMSPPADGCEQFTVRSLDEVDIRL